jgi:hypothetical protein
MKIREYDLPAKSARLLRNFFHLTAAAILLRWRPFRRKGNVVAEDRVLTNARNRDQLRGYFIDLVFIT